MVAIRQVTDEEENYIRENFEYDPGTGALWKTLKNGKKNICQCKNSKTGYYSVNIGTKYMYVHRICWFLYHGSFPTKQIDHDNNDRTDNRIKNLQEASSSENNYNRSKSKTYGGKPTSSNFKGVTAINIKGEFYKWLAQIGNEGKVIRIGVFDFDNEEDAALAYDIAALDIFGPKFAKLNFDDAEDRYLQKGINTSTTH